MTAQRQATDLGVLLFVAARALEQRAHDAVSAAGFTDITPAQARVAARIGPGGTRVSDLAAQARVAKQSAAFLVGQLEEAGYVERGPDPSDRRARLVRLSARGKQVVAVADEEVVRALAEWSEHVGADRLRQVHEALQDLRGLIDPWR